MLAFNLPKIFVILLKNISESQQTTDLNDIWIENKTLQMCRF